MTRQPILALFLALVLAAGTILSGPLVARAGTTTVELCSEAGAVTVTLDAQGNPASPHRPCPFCLAAQDTGPVPAPDAWSRPLRPAKPAVFTVAYPGASKGHRLSPSARAPPLPV